MGEVSDSITRTTEKGRCWSITLNNPSQEEIAFWNNICAQVPFVKEAKGQLEKGEQGTLHIQGMLKTDNVRFSAVKKVLPRAHIELARNAFQLERYVSKEATREGELTQSKRTVQVATPQVIQEALFDSLYNIIFDFYLIRYICDDGTFSYKLQKRVKQPFKRNAKTFLIYFKGEKLWYDFINFSADHTLKVIFSHLIQKGYYNVEFIAANKLLYNGFKNNLYDIIYRHAYHKAQSDSQEIVKREEDLS